MDLQTAKLVAMRPALIAHFRRRVRPDWQAEDLCQDTIQIALRALRENRVKEHGHLTAYVWGIARRLIGKSWRKAIRQPDALDDAPEPSDPARGPEATLLAAEQRARVHAALQALRSRDREVLEAFFLRELEKLTLCRTLSLSPAGFDLAKWRALRRFARAWEALGARSAETEDVPRSGDAEAGGLRHTQAASDPSRAVQAGARR